MSFEEGLDSLKAKFPEARDSELTRFLKARKGNETAASEKYSSFLEWKEKTFPITKTEVEEVLTKRVFYNLPGFAHDGSSILVFDGPNHHPEIYSTEQTMRAILYVAYEVFQSRDIDDWRMTLIIFAPKGTPFDIKGIAALASTFSSYFPETLSKCIVYPLGPFTPYLWGIAKPFLDPKTVEKVVLLPGGAQPPDLCKYVPESSTPLRWLSKEVRHQYNDPILFPLLNPVDMELPSSSLSAASDDSRLISEASSSSLSRGYDHISEERYSSSLLLSSSMNLKRPLQRPIRRRNYLTNKSQNSFPDQLDSVDAGKLSVIMKGTKGKTTNQILRKHRAELLLNPGFQFLGLLGLLAIFAMGAMLLMSSQSGFCHDQPKVGRYHMDGVGIKVDFKQAIFWYLKAAEQDHNLALTNLGSMYCNGGGCARNIELGVKYFLRAANLGEPLAMRNLAMSYRHGIGVPQNIKEADKWAKKASMASRM